MTTWIRTPAELEGLARSLEAAEAIGLDTESDSLYHHFEKVCLVQIATGRGEAWLVDTLAVRDLSPLAALMASPRPVKVLHGADYDVVCLKRDFGFEFRNLFDTMIASQMLGFERIGLADLIDRFFGWHIDKQYQRHDWAERPLLPEHLEYARGDTHWLIALREILVHRLARGGRLQHVLEECRLLEQREWEGREFDEDGYLRIKQAGTLDDAGKRVLRRLYLYRDAQARDLDRPTFKVIPDPVLVDIARERPQTAERLEAMFSKKAGMKRRHGEGLLRAVLEGMADDFEIPRAPGKRREKPASSEMRVPGRVVERALQALKEWRNRACERDGVAPVAVASNGTLRAIARYRPRDLDELASLSDVRDWQVRDYGTELLGVLDGVAPASFVGSPSSDDAPATDAPRRRRRRR